MKERSMKHCRFSIKILLCALLTFFVSSCGGSGGGSDSVSSDSFGIRVLHGAIEATPVEFLRPGSENDLRRASFLSDAPYVDASPGTTVVNLFTLNSGGSDLLTSGTLNIEERSRNTVFLHGDIANLGLNTTILRDQLRGEGTSLRILHGVVRASAIEVNISEVGQPQSVPFGSSSGYLEVNPGQLIYTATRAADGLLLSSGTIEITDGEAYTLLIAGEVGVFVSGKLYQDS